MPRGPRNNGALKWLALLAFLLLNSIFIISSTTSGLYSSSDIEDNNALEFDAKDTVNVTTDAPSNASSEQELRIDKDIAKKVLEETNESNGGGTPVSPPRQFVDAQTATDNSTGIDSNSTNFIRYENVVIVTKVLWPADLRKNLKPNLCYLSHAYNDKRKYDIVVFTTNPWTEDQISELQAVVAPAKLTVALEAPPLEEQVAAMTPEEKEFLYNRCNVTAKEEISWFHYCGEPGSNLNNNLGYCWQAEFRAYHIWTHPAIMKVS